MTITSENRSESAQKESNINLDQKTSSSNSNDKDDTKKWGYDLYPERKGEKYKPSWSKVLFGLEGRENIDKLKCERNVYSCVKNSPMVKLMMGALKSSGW